MASEQWMIFIGRVMKKSRQREEEPPHEGGGSKSVGAGTSKKDDVRKDIVDDVLSIEFSNRTDAPIEESMSTTVVVKLLGRRISYNALWNKVCALWKPMMRFQLMDIDNNYYLANFKSKLDYNNALSNGPWVEIESMFGKVIKIDFQTDKWSRGKFARFCGRFSHLKEGCPIVNKEDAMEGDEIHHQEKSIETQQNGVMDVHERDKSIGMEDINSRSGNGKQISVSKECSRGKTQVEVNEIKGSKRKGQKFITKVRKHKQLVVGLIDEIEGTQKGGIRPDIGSYVGRSKVGSSMMHPPNQVSIEISIPIEHAIQGMVSRLESSEQSIEALNGDGQIGEADTVGMVGSLD
ncbi:hypothetical protein Goshw_019798 [Gossypium schwendimanii]|uniref:DUF4283 domain-containing protein n=1 Tax=Gossypium schwendimanii TaxID=34291 RepID=A0A7J9M5N6_GOSSC|nr:hypothetical protein [Gossypium schwendimanii]